MAKTKKTKPLTAADAELLGYHPMQYAELRRLCIVNSDKIPDAFIIGDMYCTWVGIGIVEERRATEQEFKTLPVIVEN